MWLRQGKFSRTPAAFKCYRSHSSSKSSKPLGAYCHTTYKLQFQAVQNASNRNNNAVISLYFAPNDPSFLASGCRQHRRLSSDSWEDLSRELRHSLNRFSSPSFLHSPPRLPEPAPPSSPPRNLSDVVLSTPYCQDICVGPDDTPPPQLPNPPAETPDAGVEYGPHRPSAPYDVWDRSLSNRIEVRYIPMSLQWFQGRFHDRTEMVGSFKKDCRSWLWKNRPADFPAFNGAVLESATITELTSPTHGLPPISEKLHSQLPSHHYCDMDIPSE